METMESLSTTSNVQSNLRLLRFLGEAALTHYDLGSARLSLLANRTNTVFRVSISKRYRYASGYSPDLDGERFVLRLCSPSPQIMDMLRSEMLWLSALRNETDLIIPEPVLTRRSAYVVEVHVEDIPEIRHCILLSWVDGRFVDSGLSPTLLERVGTFMARLHQHAKHFTEPANFVRPRWDIASYLGPNTIFDPQFVAAMHPQIFGHDDYHLLARTAERLQDIIAAIPTDSNNYGMIHGNLHQNNYLFYKGEVHAIDFSRCCWGYYLFDIAQTLSSIIGRNDEVALIHGFKKGYERIRSLPYDNEEQFQAFFTLCLLRHLSAVARTKTNMLPSIWQFVRQRIHQFIGSTIVNTG